MDLNTVFYAGLTKHHYANTAYPLKPSTFMQYRVNNSEDIEKLIQNDWDQVEGTGIYIHIPFCEQRCKFCEYAVVSGDESEQEDEYIRRLIKEIQHYGKYLKNKKIIGFDVGGGTPTKISYQNLEKMTQALFKVFHFGPETGMSIETTPLIASKEFNKLRSIYQLGFQRISMGIQTISIHLLKSFERESSPAMIEKAVKNIRRAGFKHLNVDLMYGFLNQSNDDFEATIRFALQLEPEYITLYRNRYKGTKIEYEAKELGLEKVLKQYDIAFELLNSHGYTANSGKNTFSRVIGDPGTSEYLTHRVIEGTSYLGMGLGAQSYGNSYLAYNQGAASKSLKAYFKLIDRGEFPIQDIYSLPIEEMIAKMVSVAFYFGYINTYAFKKRFGIDFKTYFADVIHFLQDKGYMDFQGELFILSKEGSRAINGIIPLFYSEASQRELLNL